MDIWKHAIKDFVRTSPYEVGVVWWLDFMLCARMGRGLLLFIERYMRIEGILNIFRIN